MSSCVSICCSITNAGWDANIYPDNGYSWYGHSCYWDSFPSGMSTALRGLKQLLGNLSTTDLESILINSQTPGYRIWSNHNMVSWPGQPFQQSNVTHSQTTGAVAKIKTGNRIDTGTASITIDNLATSLRGFIVYPYTRSTPGDIWTTTNVPGYFTGNGNRRGNSRQVHVRLIPMFRLTINSLTVSTPSSTAWSLNSNQSPVNVEGVYAGPHQYGEPDLERQAFSIPRIQAIAIAPNFNCTAGAESGILSLRSSSGNYPVWLGVGAYPVEDPNEFGTWKIKQRLPAYDILAKTTSQTAEFPTCVATGFTPVNEDFQIEEGGGEA